MSLVSAVFLKLIKMIIGPLVLSTLVVGIGHMGDAATVGRVGAKTMGWFVSASIVSLLLGLFMVDLLQPGVGIVIADQATTAANLTTQAFSIDNFIDHLVPTSIFKSLADGEILQIVVFSVFAGVAIMALGERGKPLLELADGVSHMMLNITGYVMKIAPIAVCASVASVITKSGPGILLNFAKFLGGFYLTLVDPLGAADRGRPHRASARAWAIWSGACASRSCSPSRPRARKPPIRRSSNSCSGSASRAASRASCCRSAIRSTSTARWPIRPSPRCSSRRPMGSTCRSASNC